MKRIKEIWKTIPGYEGYYEVSNLGRVRSLERIVKFKSGHAKGKEYTVKERLLRPGSDGGNYKYVVLCKDGNPKNFHIHKLVMLAFVGECPEGMEVCHNDGKRSNNLLYNFRYDTRKNNLADTVNHGTKVNGEIVGSSKLKEGDIVVIRERYKMDNCSQNDLAIEYNVSQSTIWRVVNKKTWFHI